MEPSHDKDTQTRPVNRRPKQFRLPDRVVELLDRVAKSQGRSQTDVVAEATTLYAEQALLDQTQIVWDDIAYDAFEKALSGPPKPSAYVVSARKTKRAWE